MNALASFVVVVRDGVKVWLGNDGIERDVLVLEAEDAQVGDIASCPVSALVASEQTAPEPPR